MQYHEFCRKVIETLPVGTVLPNPGGGDSTIVSYTGRKVAYRKGNLTCVKRLNTIVPCADAGRVR